MGTSEGGEDQERDAGREQRLWGGFGGWLHTIQSCAMTWPHTGTGTEDRKIPGMTELAQPSSHHHTALRNNLGEVWNGPDEVEQCIQMLGQMWHLVLTFLVTDMSWKQSNTGNCTHFILQPALPLPPALLLPCPNIILSAERENLDIFL